MYIYSDEGSDRGEESKRGKKAGFVKVTGALGTGGGEHSLKAYSQLACSEAWKNGGEKWTDKIGCCGGHPGKGGCGGLEALFHCPHR